MAEVLTDIVWNSSVASAATTSADARDDLPLTTAHGGSSDLDLDFTMFARLSAYSTIATTESIAPLSTAEHHRPMVR